MTVCVVRRGLCSWCGREVPGVPVEPSGRLCEGVCPRCGREPFYLDSMGPWTTNVAKMSEADALFCIETIDDEREVEVLFRVEFLGPNRDAVLDALHRRYWTIHDVPPEATSRGRAMTLDELRKAWSEELANDDSRRMYLRLAEA